MKHLVNDENSELWETDINANLEVFKVFAEKCMLIPSLPAPLPVEWLHRVGVHELPGGLKVEDFDLFHFAIFTDEMARTGLGGYATSVEAGSSLFYAACLFSIS